MKAYFRGAYESSRFAEVSGLLKLDTVKALRRMELILPVLLLVMNFSLLAVLWFGSKQISSGEAPIGELVAVVNYAMRMTGSFTMFTFIIIAFARAKASADRMEEVLIIQEGLEILNGEDIKEIPSNSFGAIRFDNVSFSYPETDVKVLDDVSFEVSQGEKLAIMGATGSGKSALLSLIPRFYEATAGHVYVNNKDVKEWDIQSLRGVIGFVPQKSMLFTGSIEENIRWGNQTATIGEIEFAAKQAQIHESVQNFPNGYKTRVGQKGVNLSGGQKQRLSIARALIRKSQLLILDDSTSALDVKTEAMLWKSLEKEQATMLVVTQKIVTAKGADRILLLNDGKIEAFGTHEQLMKNCSLYRKIAESQQEGGE